MDKILIDFRHFGRVNTGIEYADNSPLAPLRLSLSRIHSPARDVLLSSVIAHSSSFCNFILFHQQNPSHYNPST